ncbi:hypothetical protein [Nocardia sp. NBC_00511]|uniref:hypothetical protein n=1 Tax=Nocardia sp. NBC_00511 TaxID=2903591 RepID=UPI0030DE1B0D
MTKESVRLAMSKGSVREETARILDEIIEDPATVTALLHPLGFVCFPLERDGESGVCIHAWEPDLWRLLPLPTLTTSQIHSHSWELVSCVLYGTVCNKVLDVVDVDNGPEFRVAEIHNGEAGIDMIHPIDRWVRSSVAATEWHAAGEIYRLDAGVFHTTSVEGAAATLAFGRGVRGAVDLSLTGLDAAVHSIARTRCDPETTARLARSVRERIPHGVMPQ